MPLAAQVPRLSDDDKLVLTADEVLLESDGLSNLAGMVQLQQGDKSFSAEALSYDDNQRQVKIGGRSIFRNRAMVIQSQSAVFDLDRESGQFNDTEFALPEQGARGRSGQIRLRTDGVAHLRQSAYTTCAPQSDAWYIESGRIKLDYAEGLGSARHARLRFLGVPILYLPYLQFPINDQRRTGVLYPTLGQSSDTGFDMRWPIYLNLGPNYDATFTPRLMTQRGLQSNLDARYLLASGEGQARYEYLDDSDLGEDRSLFRFDNHGLINHRLAYQTKYAQTSDRSYFEDLGGSFQSASITHLEQSARLIYQVPGGYAIRGLLQNFQPIASNLQAVDDPYKRLPQIRLNALTKNSFWRTRAGVDAEFVNFARDDSVEGTRLNLLPYLRYARDESAWYFNSQADLHYTTYELESTPAGQSKSPSRTLPVMSAEGGLRFERLSHAGRLQLLEPRAFMLYVPHESQDDIPLFDTGEPDFDFVQLFARNRFSGEDRIADARHVAGAMTLRELDPVTGLTRWRASIGQLYRFVAPSVDIAGFPPPERGATEFISELEYRFSQHLSSLVSAQWSPKEDQFERSQVVLRYLNPDSGNGAALAYRYRRNLLEQTDLSFSTQIFGNWHLAGRSRYSILQDTSLETLAGVEYSTCCWAVRGSYRRFIADTDGNFDSGFYLQLELKGLTKIGASAQGLLPGETLGEGERLSY